MFKFKLYGRNNLTRQIKWIILFSFMVVCFGQNRTGLNEHDGSVMKLKSQQSQEQYSNDDTVYSGQIDVQKSDFSEFEKTDGIFVPWSDKEKDDGGYLVPRADYKGQLQFVRGMADVIFVRLRYYKKLAEQAGNQQRVEELDNDIKLCQEILQALEEHDKDKVLLLVSQCSQTVHGLVDTLKNMKAICPADADRYYFRLPDEWSAAARQIYEKDNGKKVKHSAEEFEAVGVPAISCRENPTGHDTPPLELWPEKADGLARTVYRSPCTCFMQVVRHEDDDGDGLFGGETDVIYQMEMDGWYFLTGEISSDDSEFDCNLMYAKTKNSSSDGMEIEAWDTDGGWSKDDQIDISPVGSDVNFTYNFSTKHWSGDVSTPYSDGGGGNHCWFSVSSSYDDDEGQRSITWQQSESNHRSGCLSSEGSTADMPVIQNNSGQRYESDQNYIDEYYKFWVRSGDYFQIYMDGLDTDLDLYLYNPSGTYKDGSFGTGSSEHVEYTADATGWWYIKVHSFSGYADWYYLYFSNYLENDYNYITDGASDRGFLVDDYGGETNYKDNEDYYKFYVTAGQCINFSISHDAGDDFDLALYNPSGSYKRGSYGTGTSDAVSYCADATGYWYAKPYQYSGWGYYIYSLDITAEPSTPSLSSPANGAHFDGGVNVNFNWSDVTCDKYKIHFRRSAPDAMDLGDFTTYSSSYSKSFSVPGTYYWKVVAQNSCGSDCGDNWTSERYFYIDNLAAPVGWDLQDAFPSWGGKGNQWDNEGEYSDGCGWLSLNRTDPSGPYAGQYNMRDYWRRYTHDASIRSNGCGPGTAACSGEGTPTDETFYNWQLSASPNSGGYDLHSAGSDMCYVKPYYGCDTGRMYYRDWLGASGAVKIPETGFKVCFTHCGHLGPSDYGRVYYSINGGTSWIQITAYSSLPADWTYVELNLGAAVGTIVHIRFEIDTYRANGAGVRRNYAGWWIDDIGIVKPFSAGTMPATQYVCAGGAHDINLPTGQTGGHTGVPFEYKLQESPTHTNWTDVDGVWRTTATADNPPSDPYYYRYMVRRGPSWGYASSYTTTIKYNTEPAGTWTGRQNTEWMESENWGQCQIPSGIAVIIPNVTNDPEISSAVPNITKITVNSGAVLTINSSGSINMTTTGTDCVRDYGTIKQNNGNLDVDGYFYVYGGGKYYLYNGTCDISRDMRIYDNNGTLADFAGGTATIGSGGTYCLRVGYSGSGTGEAIIEGATVNSDHVRIYSGGLLTMTSGILNITNASNYEGGYGGMDVYGAANVSGGIVNIAADWEGWGGVSTFSGTADINITGHWFPRPSYNSIMNVQASADLTCGSIPNYQGTINQSGGTIHDNGYYYEQRESYPGGQFHGTGGTIEFGGASYIDIDSDGTYFYNVNITGTRDLGAATDSYVEEMDVNGDLTITGSLDSDGRNVEVAGSWINNGTFIHDNDNVTFDGASGENHISGTSLTTFYNLYVTKSGGNIGLTQDIAILHEVNVSSASNVGIWVGPNKDDCSFYYDMEKLTGAQLEDLSGHSHNGTVEGTPTAGDSGVVGKAYDFNAGTDRIYVTSAGLLGATVTISLWATFNGGNHMLWCIDNDNTGPNLYFTGGNIYLNTWDGTSNPFCAQPANVENWHHYVTIIQSGNTKLYIDGVEAGTANYRTPTETVFYIGSSSTTYDWDGKVDEVAVFNRALTLQEIQALYHHAGVFEIDVPD
ncbi:pre-peptidase C-terminal domain-containing protein [bacterium]|nr:pre-peptidase C-terminal domain-containing protein [bacterium]